MDFFAPRTCTEVAADNSKSFSLKELRDHSAYVLLGGPGAGKTEAFKHEAKRVGGHYVTARDFIALKLSRWHNAVLFIDGLDEVRAGRKNKREPFDDIRTKLDRLGCPRFRISCRTIGWHGENDSLDLKPVSPNGKVAVFQLDPLSDDAIREFLEHQLGNENVEEFQKHVRERGIHFLLTNPQSLQMLSDLAADNTWPKTRMQLFDIATRKLLRERNKEHIHAEDVVPQEALMGAAEKLCALQLLSGINGYTFSSRDSSNCPNLDEMPGENHALFKRSLGTKLFKEEKESGCIIPIHAQIAEFLAGRHLEKSIKNGFSIRRILALMTDENGAIAIELRGLAAWLATHSSLGRAQIIDLDPLGVALGADIRIFSKDEKTRLLENLKSVAGERPWYRILDRADSILGDWTIPELGGLATPEMEEQLQACLEDLAPENSSDTSFAMILLEAIRHGTIQQGLADLVMGIVRDNQWDDSVREFALEEYIRLTKNESDAAPDLLSLLQDIKSGLVSDPRDQLSGYLLEALFPENLSAEEVLQHLHPPRWQNYHGQYMSFWLYGILSRSTPDLLVDLLDAFVEQHDRLCNEVAVSPGLNLRFREIPAGFLSHFLRTGPDQLELDKLFTWLGAAVWHGDWSYQLRSVPHITAWLEQNPGAYKSLIRMGWEYCSEKPECTDLHTFGRCLYMVERRFFGTTPPQDLSRWHLDQSITTADRVVQEYLIRKVADAVYLKRYGEDFTVEAIEKKILDDDFLLEKFRERLSSHKASENNRRNNKFQEFREQTESENRQLEQEWYDEIKKHESALRENRCAPGILYFLARAYFDEIADVDAADSQTQLHHILKNDAALIEAALYGLRKSIERDDLPDAVEVIRLRVENMVHPLSLPFLAGLEETRHSILFDNTPLSCSRIRLTLAIHYTGPSIPNWRDSNWYKKVLKEQPQLVADVLIQSTRSDLRAKKDCQRNLHELAFPASADHSAVARLVALPLLQSFQPRAAADQFPSLRTLLCAAILQSGKKPFLRLIERKLSRSSMTAAQRTCWLTAGFWVAPETYNEKLQRHAVGNDLRIRQIIEFVAQAPDNVLARCKTEFLPCLIQLLGPSCVPWFHQFDRSGTAQWVTPAMTTGRCIEAWIKQLAVDPSQKVTRALDGLAADSSLKVWEGTLKEAQYVQKELARKTNSRYSSIRQVINTLRNDKPANAADLSALTCDKLAEISRRIRDGSPAEWRQYWNKDTKTREPLKPQHEDDCRDTLLTHLQARMERLEIDAQPEGNYADDKRSDIRLFYKEFNIPVEIKKSSHRDLWTAVEKQLIKQYTRDPGADGCGIYLVFWLGKDLCQQSPTGTRPESAEELQQQLQNTLTGKQSRKISICVLDIEPPPAKTGARPKKRSASRGFARQKSARRRRTKTSKSQNR